MKLEPMNFQKYKGQKVRWLQHKLDGYYVEVHRTATGFIVIQKSGKEDIWPKLESRFAKAWRRLPVGMVLRGELHRPGTQATSVPTLINDPEADLWFTPFLVEGGAVSSNINVMNQWLVAKGFTPPTTIDLGDWKVIDLDHWKEAARTLGIEGFVAKESSQGPWYKIKPPYECDAVVVSVQQSFSNAWYPGMKSVDVAVYDHIGPKAKLITIATVGSGFEGTYRLALNTGPKRDELIGRVCEVQYDAVAAKGRLKFPRFIRWREDKEAKACLLNQL